MEQIFRSAADLNENQRQRLANHLRSVDRAEAAAYASQTPSEFYAAVARLTRPADEWANAFALEQRLIRPTWIIGPVGSKNQGGFTLNGSARDFLTAFKPVANPWLRPVAPPTREPLMGERLMVAEAVAA